MIDYLRKLNQAELFTDLVEYASLHHVPIIKEESLWLLKKLISLKKVRRILEIGTAIGYSAMHMAALSPDIIVDTIERDQMMQTEAAQNRAKYHFESQIILHKGDALELDLAMLAPSYDLIFIDAAKAQYQKFFLKYTPLLQIGGMVVTDNILYHQLVSGNDMSIKKNTQSLVRKIDAYNQWLRNLDQFNTTFLSIGDGLAISERIK